jgi:Flp pilus assembly secretin CpaC
VDTATAQATVSAANGETIVLGGLISTRRELVERRAPFLSDIPVLGRLFSFDSNEMRRAELLIILTPHVIRNAEDSERLKQAEFARMSWCAADVYDLYGDVGLDFQVNMTQPNDMGVETIYPDINPRGSSGAPAESGESMRPLPYPPNDNTLPLPTDPLFRGPGELLPYPESSRRDQPVRPAEVWR